MRRIPVVLVAAVAALSPIPAASAHSSPASEETPEACPPPDVVARYHPDRFSVSVALPTTGCPTRENGDFSLQVWLDRVDEHTGEGHGRVVPCGDWRDACELDMWIGHPSPEAGYYDLAVIFPGAGGEETLESHSFCRTDDDGAYCVEAE